MALFHLPNFLLSLPPSLPPSFLGQHPPSSLLPWYCGAPTHPPRRQHAPQLRRTLWLPQGTFPPCPPSLPPSLPPFKSRCSLWLPEGTLLLSLPPCLPSLPPFSPFCLHSSFLCPSHHALSPSLPLPSLPQVSKYLLLSLQASLFTQDVGGFTPLLNAIWRDDRAMVSFLLSLPACDLAYLQVRVIFCFVPPSLPPSLPPFSTTIASYPPPSLPPSLPPSFQHKEMSRAEGPFDNFEWAKTRNRPPQNSSPSFHPSLPFQHKGMSLTPSPPSLPPSLPPSPSTKECLEQRGLSTRSSGPKPGTTSR